MKTLLSVFLAVLFISSHALFAQDEEEAAEKDRAASTKPETEDTADDKPDLTLLPRPLSYINSNITDIEEAGYFKILDARYGALRENTTQMAIVWTLRAEQNMTYRRAKLFFDQFRDVRFYYVKTYEKEENKPTRYVEVHSTLLYYSRFVDVGSVNGESLRRGSRLEIWMYIDTNDIRRALGREANRVVFSRSRSR